MDFKGIVVSGWLQIGDDGDPLSIMNDLSSLSPVYPPLLSLVNSSIRGAFKIRSITFGNSTIFLREIARYDKVIEARRRKLSCYPEWDYRRINVRGASWYRNGHSNVGWSTWGFHFSVGWSVEPVSLGEQKNYLALGYDGPQSKNISAYSVVILSPKAVHFFLLRTSATLEPRLRRNLRNTRQR